MTSAEALKEISRMRKNGISFPEITAAIAAAGYKTKAGKKPETHHIEYMFRNAKPSSLVAYERVDDAPKPAPTPKKDRVMVILGTPEQVRMIMQGAMP